MNFGTNKTSVKVIKEGVFGGTYFTDIYCSVNGKCYIKSWKEFDQLKDIDQKYYYNVITMLVLINMVLNVEHH